MNYIIEKASKIIYIFFLSTFLFNQHLCSQNILNGNYTSWTRLANSPSKKVEAQAVVYNNQLYVFAGIYGYTDNTQTGSSRFKFLPSITTEKYDPTLNKWTELANLPDNAGITHYGIALVDDKVWIVGGRLNAVKKVTNKVWVYNITTNTWSSGPALPENLASGALVKIGRKLHFLAGGTHLPSDQESLCVLTNYHYILDLDNQNLGWKLDATIAVPLHIQSIHSSVVQMGGQIYLIGGQYGHDCENQGDTDHSKVFRFNFYLNKWDELASLPTANSHNEGATFTIDGKIYTVGGQIIGNEVREYNPTTNSWRVVDYLKDEFGKTMKLIGPIAKVIQNKLLMVNGGINLNNYNTTEKAYVKNFSRTYNKQLVFLPDTIQQTMNSFETDKQISAWLSTLDGKATYTTNISNLPAWLHITKDAGNITDETSTEFKITFRPSQVGVGNYHFPLTITASNYSSVTVPIYLTVTNQSLITPFLRLENITQNSVELSWTASNTIVGNTTYQIFSNDTLIGTTANLSYKVANLISNTDYRFTVRAKDEANHYSNFSNEVYATTLASIPNNQIIRINAGGSAQTVDGITWAGCSTGSCNVYAIGGKSYTQSGSPFISGVQSPLNQPIYQTEWTGGQSTGIAVGQTAFSFNFPVQNGTYIIRLYFAELNKNGVGLRVFDVNIEGGIKELVNFDIFKEIGYRKALMKEFTFQISDNNIQIDFIRQVENAKVSAIEIIQQNVDTEAPTKPTLSLGSITQNSVALNWTTSTDNIGVVGYDVFNGTNLITTTTNTNFTFTGLTANTAYTFTVKAKDEAGNSSVASNAVNATTLPAPITTTTRYEAEVHFQVVADAPTSTIVVGNNTIASAGKDVRTVNTGDNIKLNFATTQSGQYILKVNARSGNNSNPTTFWSPMGYAFKLNNVLTIFVGNPSTVSSTSSTAYGSVGAYFGVMESSILNLGVGVQSLEIEMLRSSLGVDYLDVVLQEVGTIASPITEENNHSAIQSSKGVIQIFPNPIVGERLFISMLDEIKGQVQYEILDSQGRKILQQQIFLEQNGYTISIDLKKVRLANGVYFLKINGDNLVEKNIRFIKI